MKIVGVIPARYKSSRFPGKPLADICGKPMIWWVYHRCKKVEEFDEVYVATDDERIKSVCEAEEIKVVMTSEQHKTGTDRVAEVAEKIYGDLFVIVMGDEPLVSPDNIRALISAMKKDTKYDGGMLCEKFKSTVDVINSTTIKLAINSNKELIYMSRLPIPFPKAFLNYDHYKNVGVYAFTNKVLKQFNETARGPLEEAEDCEMLRLLENHKLVKVVEIESSSMSVDTEKDLVRIRKVIEKEISLNEMGFRNEQNTDP